MKLQQWIAALLARKGRRASVLFIGACILAMTTLSASAANPAPVQVFYVSEPEDDVFDAMVKIELGGSGNAPTSPMTTIIAISIRQNNTVVYYDHWEDGFADDIANPTAGEIYANPGNLDGVQIWGDGNTANGAPPGFPGDVLNSGNVIYLQNNVVVPNLASTIDYDGSDKIGATNFVAVSRSIWANSSGSLLAFAASLYDTLEWGQTYTAPVGCNTASQNQMFEYAAFSVTAAYDGTVVEVDTDGNGSFETTSATLNEGDTYFIDASPTGPECDYIREGAKIRSTDAAKPIQAVLWTGDIASNYESRDLNMVPDDKLDNSYYIPVGVNTNPTGARGPVQLFIYNLENSNLFVRCEAHNETWDLTIAPDTVNSTVSLDNNQAAHCFAVTAAGGTTPDNSRAFTGLGAVDAATDPNTGQASNWGIPFVPESGLSNQALIGLGLGRDPTSGTNPNENGTPIWITPVCTTFFYVDWNNDGTPDKVDFNGDNDVTDNDVDSVATLDEPTSNNGFSIGPGRSVRLFNPDNTTLIPSTTVPRRQTGAYIYTKTAANNGGTGGCEFAAAWGQDSRTASGGAPGMDLGTIVVNLRSMETSKATELLTDADNNGVPSPGDTIRYLVTIENTGLAPIAVSAFDILPAGVTYVPNSTEKNITAGYVPVPDNTGFPLDNNPPYGLLLGTAQIGETFFVRFNATIDEIAPNSVKDIVNCALLSHPSSGPDPKTAESCDTLEVYSITLSGNVFNDTNGLGDNTVNGTGIGSPSGTQLYANLVGPNGNVVAVVAVNANGTYQFADVTPNTTYRVVLSTTQGTVGNPAPAASLPVNWINTGENLGAGAGSDGNANGVLSVAVVTSNVTNANFGIQTTATGQIGDKIWRDQDGDGVQDAGEPGIPGVTVELDPPAGVNLGNGPGNPVTTTTDANGNYLFSNLPAGNYTVTVTPPAGTTNTGDPDGGFDSTSAVSLTTGQSNLTQDFGYRPTGQIGDTIWRDDNGNGVQDNGEPGIPGVTVALDPPAGVDLGNGSGNPVTTTTDANGNYLFSNLPAGAYTVTVTPPPGTTNTGDPDGGFDSTSAVNLTAGQSNLLQDFGYQANPINLSGNVFNDTNGLSDNTVNGTGIGSPSGVQLYANLVGPNGNVVAVDDVAANGTYGFSNVTAHTTYTVVLATTQGTVGQPAPTASLPATWSNTGENLGAGAGSDGNPNGVLSVPVAASNVTNANFGILQTPISLSGNVFNDANGLTDNTVNGTGIGSPSGTQLYANLVSAGNVVATVPINANGTYTFNNVTPNTAYTVVLATTQGTVGNPAPAASLPPGWANTGENLGAGAGNDGTVNGVLAVPVATSSVTNANFGIQETSQIGDTIWRDDNGNGVQDNGEPGIPGVTVTLDPPAGIDLGAGPGNPVTDVTDANGNYLFSNLPPGSYTVTVTPPPGTTNTGDPDGGNDSTSAVTLTAGQSNLDQDFGYQPTGQIGDTIWRDDNGNGVQDNGEPGIPGVTVTLDPPAGVDLGAGPGNPVIDTTDANGNYLFEHLPAGNYTVTVTPPPGTTNTGDPDGGNDSTSAVSLTDGEVDLTQDFGYQPSLQIGDKIWQDNNGDGVQDVGEPGIPGVTVTLDPPAGVDLGNGPGNPVTDVTDANGNYLFSNLPPGSYTVTVTPPPGTTNTGDPDGGNDSTAAVTLTTQSNLNQDFGYQPDSIVISGNVFVDLNGLSDNTVNGTGIGQPGGTQLYANLVGPNGNVVAVMPVNANGTYQFNNVTPNTTFTVVLATTQGTVGNPAPAASLPPGWANTGENLGAGPGSDGSVNGVLTVPVATSNVTNANFGIQPLNVCPVNSASNRWTDILGIGMGNTKTHKAMAKVIIPNSTNVVELYGQMAAKQTGLAKFVRFLYPNSTYEQVGSITSPASQAYGVFWYGSELDRAAHIRGRWFLQKTGTSTHIPRALIVYPTYTDPTRQWVNVFETLDGADTQVYWETAGGWTPTQVVELDIPAPLAPTTFNVEVAMVDNDADTRPVEVTVSAGGVSVMQAPTGPNRGDLLNIMTFTLSNVPAGTDTITITIHSPAPNAQLFYGGDSAAITGVTANYECVTPR